LIQLTLLGVRKLAFTYPNKVHQMQPGSISIVHVGYWDALPLLIMLHLCQRSISWICTENESRWP